MTAATRALLVVTGLRREAQIVAGDGVVTMCSGSDPALLRERLSALKPDTDEAIGGVLSFGLAGGLAPDLQPGDVVLATRIAAADGHHDVAYDWHDAIASKLEGAGRFFRGTIAATDSVLTKSTDKDALHALSGALAVDTESHVAAAFAHRHGLSFAALRVISDPAARSLPKIAAHALRPDGTIDLVKVLGSVARNPGQIAALAVAGLDSERAFAALRRCRRLLGPRLGLGGANL